MRRVPWDPQVPRSSARSWAVKKAREVFLLPGGLVCDERVGSLVYLLCDILRMFGEEDFDGYGEMM